MPGFHTASNIAESQNGGGGKSWESIILYNSIDDSNMQTELKTTGLDFEIPKLMRLFEYFKNGKDL